MVYFFAVGFNLDKEGADASRLPSGLFEVPDGMTF